MASATKLTTAEAVHIRYVRNAEGLLSEPSASKGRPLEAASFAACRPVPDPVIPPSSCPASATRAHLLQRAYTSQPVEFTVEVLVPPRHPPPHRLSPAAQPTAQSALCLFMRYHNCFTDTWRAWPPPGGADLAPVLVRPDFGRAPPPTPLPLTFIYNRTYSRHTWRPKCYMAAASAGQKRLQQARHLPYTAPPHHHHACPRAQMRWLATALLADHQQQQSH